MFQTIYFARVIITHNISRGHYLPCKILVPCFGLYQGHYSHNGSFDMIKPMYERTAMEDFRFFTIIFLGLSIFEPAGVTVDL
jgi:hypothetical protein